MSLPVSQQQSVRIEVTVDPTVSLAALQNDVPAVKALAIDNQSEEPLRDVTLAIRAEPEFAAPFEARVAAIGPGQRYTLEKVDLVLSPDFLVGATERTRGVLHVEVRDAEKALGSTSCPLDVLAYDDWSGGRSLPELIAAFVMPNHPVIERLLAEALEVLRAGGKDPMLDGYQRGSRKAVMEMTAAIYDAVCRQQLRYINPPASFEEVGQKVRTPDRIVANRMATCLDLSVLLAACLEQAGLHPLIVFTEGHAFTGVWLDEHTFATATSDDGIDLRKRVDAGQAVVFETTVTVAPTPASFDKAVAIGRGHLDDEQRFMFVVDVRRARLARIRPIQGRVSQVVVFEPLPPAAEPAPTGLSSAPAVHEPVPVLDDNDPRLNGDDSRLATWRRKLLDLSLNNRLLNFRPTKKTAPLLCPRLAELEDRLADGKPFQLLPRPPELSARNERDAAAPHVRNAKDEAVAELLSDSLTAGKLYVDLDDSALDAHLTTIYREARLAIEESGTSALYCALGFLHWYAKDSSEQLRRAPLLLIPVELTRGSVASGFRLELGSDEPRINVTLLQMLEQDFDLRIHGLDPLPTDEHGVDVPKVLAILRQAISDIPRWEVREEAQLGFFSFSKFLMWRDLQEHAGDLLENDVVRHLIEKPGQPFDPGAPIPDANRLDVERRPEATFCPLSADSSQLEAVFAAQDGLSFVLKGPPGTGKSQTITNIIAQCLAAGKSVLFVAEKNVALNVVRKRLEQVGLGDYCLELHSSKARKVDVLRQIERAMNREAAREPDDFAREAARVEQLRSDLNAYVDALHRPREIGLTVYQALSRSLALRSLPRVPLSWAADTIDEARLTRLRELVARVVTYGEQCGDLGSHPWRHVTRTEWTPSWQADVERALEELRQAALQMRQALDAMLPVVGTQRAPERLSDIEPFVNACATLVDCPYVPEPMLVAGDWGSLQATTMALIERGQQRDALRAGVLAQFHEGVLTIDLDEVIARLRRTAQSFSLVRWFARWRVRRRLRGMVRAGFTLALDKLQGVLEEVLRLRHEEAELQRLGQSLAPALGQYWSAGDWQGMAHAVRAATTLRSAAGAMAASDPERTVALRRRWSALISERFGDLRANGSLGMALLRGKSAFDELRRAIAAYASLVGTSEASLGETLEAIVAHTEQAPAEVHQLRVWCQWQAVRGQAEAEGLSPLLSAYESGALSSRELMGAFDRAFYEWWLATVFDREPLLAQFNSADHARKIELFRQTDDVHRELVTAAVRARLSARAPIVSDSTSKSSSLGILRRELQKKRRHKAVRTLLAETSDVIFRLTPCFLMSPISVSQYLAPGLNEFDLVIFDEASQIPSWDAVGAMARGRRTIVVGDPKQLPPTNFFGRANDEDGNDDDVEDLESILDECLGSGIPDLHLSWHYRSRHESLIAFSNHHYYDNKLLTFPSSDTDREHGCGVSLRYIEDGVYDKGKSRTNRREAEEVVAEIVRRLKDPSASKSIGVVTFNSQQMFLIEDLLDAARREDPSLESAFSEDAEERLMVKNLESIQGDERDVIFFSIGYGPDHHGKVSMNFGPMNREGGQRRLNVAITRARTEVIVFSSLRPEQIDLSRTKAEGVRDLKGFLAYAERGYRAIAEVSEQVADAAFESPFEMQVCERLRVAGWTVHPQVGCSGYRIDLGVVDPDAPGRYLIGVECDGATYHRAATARDRDKLRAEVLRGLGWRLHRIWSTDWWNDPEGEMARLQHVLEEALRQRREEASIRQLTAHPGVNGPESSEAQASPDGGSKRPGGWPKASGTIVMPAVDVPEPSSAPRSSATIVMEAADASGHAGAMQMPAASSSAGHERFAAQAHVSTPARSREDERQQAYRATPVQHLGVPESFYDGFAFDAVRQAVLHVVATEGPISLSLLSKRIGAMWQFGRTTAKVTAHVESVAAGLPVVRTTRGGDFYWPAGTDPDAYPYYRVPTGPADQREPEDLPLEELANAAHVVLQANITLPRADLIKETARLIGYQRVGQRVRDRIHTAVDHLCATDRARPLGDSITLAG